MSNTNHAINEDQHLVTFAIKDVSKTPPTLTWTETVQVGDKPVTFKIDTGSDVNLISHDNFKKLKPKPKLVPSAIKLSSYSGHIISIIGTSDLKCSRNGKGHVLKFFITGLNFESVLGLQACIDFGIVAKIPSAIEAHSAEKTVKLFADVFDPPEMLRCKSHHINLLSNAKPSQAICRKVGVPLKIKIEAELQRMVDNGILELVEESISKWMHPCIITDTLRVYMDCRALNRFIVVDQYPMPMMEEALSMITSSQCFSILTAPQGFTQIPLDTQSANICTMATPCGKYRFKTIPFGLVKASETYHSIVSQILDGIDDVLVYVDEILIHGKTKDEHNSKLIQVLERARKFNLKFSRAKLQLCKTEVRFLGYILSKNGVVVDPNKIEAIKSLAMPINKQEVQRFLGMINYLGQSIPNFSVYCEPLRKLLPKSEKFVWGKEQEIAFCTLKNLLCDPPTLRSYNPNKPIYISAAASSYGLGAVALQDGQPLGYYSSVLDYVQQKYAQIEKKLLAILCALERFYFYTYGRVVIVQSDHRPLLTIIKEPMDAMSSRLQTIILKLMKFHFKLEYVAGKDLVIAYTLSRNPLKQTNNNNNLIEAKALPAHTLLCATDERITEFKQSLKEDAVLQSVVTYIKNGWPKYPSWIKNEARKYFNLKEELNYTGELLFCGSKLVVPQKEKQKVLKQLHNAHQSMKSCLQKAKLVYYWPTMLKDIESFVTNCLICQRYSKTTIISDAVSCQIIPELPWNKLGINFVHVDRRDYVIIIDYFSKFLILKLVNVKTAKASAGIFEDAFSTHGLPLEVVSDNAPPFNMPEWKAFLKTYDIKLTYVNNDDFIEKHTQIAKSLIKKSINSNMGLFLAVLEYNATPKQNFPSPSELLMGRRLRTSLLVPKTMLIPNYDISKAVSAIKRNGEVQRLPNLKN